MPINELVLPSNFDCRVRKEFIDEMATLCDDNACVPKRLRKLDDAYGRNESQKMRCVHYESALVEQTSIAASSSGPEGKLSTGQSVHHWWASWFKTATEPKSQISKRLRPKWYNAVVIAALGVKRVMYAGQWFEEHTYQVGNWNGYGEEVPERFLKPLPQDPAYAQGPAPDFWIPFNTFNVNAQN